MRGKLAVMFRAACHQRIQQPNDAGESNITCCSKWGNNDL